jgi:alcohol oxidase
LSRRIVFRVSNESATSDDFLRGDKEIQKELFQEWEVSPEVFHAEKCHTLRSLESRKRAFPRIPSMQDLRYTPYESPTPVRFNNIIPQIRPTEAELKEMGPEFNKLWDTYFKDKVCRLAMSFSRSNH